MTTDKEQDSYIKALKITLYYGAIGMIGISLFNGLVNKLVSDPDQYIKIHQYKEWALFSGTMLIFYSLIKENTRQKNKLKDLVNDQGMALVQGYCELPKEAKELRQQFETLKNDHDHLLSSDERYKLVIEGSRDGVWDWDLVEDVFYSSIRYKEQFGYEKGEIDNTYDAWISLIHPEDLQQEEQGLQNYILSKEGIYENVYRVRAKDGSYRWILSKAKAMWHEEGWPIRIAGSHTDVTEQKEMEDKVYSLAYYNVLTGMPNRSKFEQAINDKINEYVNTKNKFAIIYMNADNFRRINDTWGYEVGDELLKYISSVLLKYDQTFYLCAHLGGDEFAIIVDKIDDRSQLVQKLQKVLAEFESPWRFKKHKIFITLSVGIVLYPDHGDSLYSLVVNADTAMRHVKDHGKDGHGFFTKAIQTKRVTYIQTAHQIRTALKNKEFTVYYQPQIDLATGKVAGMEALIRWNHPEKGFISPNEFIPLAEATGEIHAIGRFVLKTVCKQKKEWEEKGYPEVIISVNISGVSLTRGDLAQEIEELLKTYQIQGSGIRIEVTETSIMNDMVLAISTLEKIKELGVKVALDDFGTGYSSLTYLQNLPIDVVKIDKEFIKNIEKKDGKEIIVEIVVQIANALNLEVVAEGVETLEQLAYVIESRCEQAQGYFFSKPMAPLEIENILEAGFRYKI